ncbi:phosphate transport system protein [Methylomagnum ishizawai]|uniref:Phosphate-specific transport system accessory protein PhoU n=1 Tax=Methylomagnum ishizawai TaxID=1760988 RepID=A0A1Y6D9N6_9GAMM|nr:phosphate signaling complex protein PhoU [Methylomagnum ishizawai]SMF97403.1 phosphate transport system protein [Methylomagnum ishizawai]
MPEPFDSHTVKRYDGELNHLHYLVLDMGGLVLGQIRAALAAFKCRDVEEARRVVASDRVVDQMEVQADDEIVKLIARRAPVGSDLRMVMAVSKSISDLERIGDEAVRIASLAIQLFGSEGSDPGNRLLRDVNRMGELAVSTLAEALEVFEVWDEAKARHVLANYHEMEEEFQADLRRLMTYIIEDSRNIGFTIGLVLAIKALERIGHHAHNLAEYVIFQVEGEDIRADD